MIQRGLYRHLKSGRIYWVSAVAINANNDSPGKKTVIYELNDHDEKPTQTVQRFTRDLEEFAQKFERMEEIP